MRERVGSSPTTLKYENKPREKNQTGVYRRVSRENSEPNGQNSDRRDGGAKAKMI